MKNIILILTILSSIFLGCVQPPVSTPTPVPTPIPTATVAPTIIPPTPTPVPTPVPTPREAVTYKVWIDSDRGFYVVRALNNTAPLDLPPSFNVLNFTVNVGDKVRWINDDSYNFQLTLVSNEGLWTPRPAGFLRWQGDQFEYTFNQTGNYTFSIKEYPRIKSQRILVNP